MMLIRGDPFSTTLLGQNSATFGSNQHSLRSRAKQRVRLREILYSQPGKLMKVGNMLRARDMLNTIEAEIRDSDDRS